MCRRCTACMDVSLLRTGVNFNTPPLAQIAPFDARFASHTRKKARLPTQSVQASECRYDSCTITAWSWKSVCSSCKSTRSVNTHENSYCWLLLQYPCFAHKCHDPFIVRSASNYSTFPRFHSVCASVSMFTINIDNYLFQFLC